MAMANDFHDGDQLFLEQVGSMDRTNAYLAIDYITSYLKEKSAKKDIYIHNKWVSFKSKTTKKIFGDVVKKDCDKSCCASTAVREFRESKSNLAIFFIHTMLDRFTGKEANFHANVLCYDKNGHVFLLFDPFEWKIATLPRLVVDVVKLLSQTREIFAMNGKQKKTQSDCVANACRFALDIVNEYTHPDRKAVSWKQMNNQMYTLKLKH